MKTYFDILPNEIHEIIYRYVFDSCLEELKQTYSREWIDGIGSRYRCIDCCPNRKTYYPNLSPFKCTECESGLCWRCWRRTIVYSKMCDDIRYANRCEICRWEL